MTVSLQHELRAYNVWEPDVTDPRPAWHATAACRGRTDWFHIDWVTTTEARPQLTERQAVCATCTHHRECAGTAIDAPYAEGVWAGVVLWPQKHRTPALDQLATIAGRPADRIAHGTNTGYYQHRRQGQPPCDRCREAHRLHEAGRTARAS